MEPTNPPFAFSSVTDVPYEQPTNGAPNLEQESGVNLPLKQLISLQTQLRSTINHQRDLHLPLK